MMTQEEEDLEEELRCLDIREDHGAEDSDATPVNTPPASPPVLYIKKFPHGRPVEDKHKDAGRYSRYDEYDSRTESSLSWGEDEFEGEATRQVGALFDQLDHLLYQEEEPLSPIPYPCVVEDSTNSPCFMKNSNSSPKLDAEFEELPQEGAFNNLSRLSSESSSSLDSQREQLFDLEDTVPSEIFYDSGRLLPSKSPVTHKPSPELQEECSDWVQQFPHIRVRGYQVNSKMLSVLDQCLDAEDLSQDSYDDDEEEVIAQDGDFYHLLPLVTCDSAARTNHVESSNPKRAAPSSRVCSGSNDPEVLKEQVLIMLFNKLWLSVTGIIEPLLHQYARYVIEQSVQYSSLSRESSTRGSRIGSQVFSRKVSEEFVRTKPKYPVPSNTLHRPTSEAYRSDSDANRPMSSIRRPSSANRLQSATSVSSIHQEELKDLLQVSPKPLQSLEDRGRGRTSSASTTRESSAQSFKSQISLPSLSTPRTPVHRPVSSKAANHLLTPMRVEVLTGGAEQRPTSTSSYNSRARFQEKLQHLSRQGTIQESRGDCLELDMEEEPTSAWSRHISFLPPITDGEASSCKSTVGQQGGKPAAITKRRGSSADRTLSLIQDVQQPQSPVMTGGNPPLATLSVRGKTLLAAHRPHAHSRAKKHILGTPIIEGGRSQKLIQPSQK